MAGTVNESQWSERVDQLLSDFEQKVMEFTSGKGVDIALDAVGGESFKKSYKCLAPMGRVYLFGASSLAPGTKRSIVAALKGFLKMPTFKPIPMMNDNRGAHGVNLGHLWDEAPKLTAMLNEIIALVQAGTFDPVISETFPLEKAADAHAYIQARKNFGKVILTC